MKQRKTMVSFVSFLSFLKVKEPSILNKIGYKLYQISYKIICIKILINHTPVSYEIDAEKKSSTLIKFAQITISSLFTWLAVLTCIYVYTYINK